MKKLSLLAVTLFSASLLISSCGNTKSEQNADASNMTISIDGSSTVYPITEAVAEMYRSEAPDVKVTVGVSGTGGGFKKFGRGETEISDASRAIKEKEIALCKENNISYEELSVAYDGLAVIANPENNWLETITVAELKKIWEPAAQGVIMKWNQIRPEWPNEEIHLYGPGVASGTYDYFTEAIVGESGKSRGDFTASEDDNVLVQGIAGDKFGLGFFGIAYYEENMGKLKLVKVDNGKGGVAPSLETVMDGTYSPLARPLFIYVNSVAATKKHVVDFVNFYLANAGNLAKEVGYIPLRAEEYKAQQDKFAAFLKSLETAK
ncbi:MAG: PstS family phosphate ABC transporter substrate-binding protein [Chitinophagaceae bacterium]|nr:PstS family phosphate ABC transporter substrate-binding protein [Chitinophagaceae bacterium]